MSATINHDEYNGYAIASYRVPKGVQRCPNGGLYSRGQRMAYDCRALGLYAWPTLRGIQSAIRMQQTNRFKQIIETIQNSDNQQSDLINLFDLYAKTYSEGTVADVAVLKELIYDSAKTLLR